MSSKDRELIKRTEETILDLRNDLMQFLMDDTDYDVMKEKEVCHKYIEYRLKWLCNWLNKGEAFKREETTMTYDENGITINFR